MIRTLDIGDADKNLTEPFSPNYLWAKPGWERLQNKGIIALGINLTKRLMV